MRCVYRPVWIINVKRIIARDSPTMIYELRSRLIELRSGLLFKNVGFLGEMLGLHAVLIEFI